MTRIGISGHQQLDRATAALVADALSDTLRGCASLHGITSLAEGADQIFAEAVLAQGGSLTAIIPCAAYECSFGTERGRRDYLRLRHLCSEVIELPFSQPCEEAYWAAGQKVVELSDELFAVWDGQPSGGLGGTADVVAFARERGVSVTVIWPPGSSRA